MYVVRLWMYCETLNEIEVLLGLVFRGVKIGTAHVALTTPHGPAASQPSNPLCVLFRELPGWCNDPGPLPLSSPVAVAVVGNAGNGGP